MLQPWAPRFASLFSEGQSPLCSSRGCHLRLALKTGEMERGKVHHPPISTWGSKWVMGQSPENCWRTHLSTLPFTPRQMDIWTTQPSPVRMTSGPRMLFVAIVHLAFSSRRFQLQKNLIWRCSTCWQAFLKITTFATLTASTT